MFCYGCARCSGEYTCCCGNIECTGPISTSATSIDRLCCDVLFQLHSYSFPTHNTCQSSDFLYCLASRAQAQSRQKGSHLCLGCNACHNFFHHSCCLAFTQGGSGCDMRDCITDHLLLLSIQYIVRKLRSRSFPMGVMIDSGWNCTPSTG